MFYNVKIAAAFLTMSTVAYGEAAENWYLVDNYIGNIGKYPVHLSIQKYDFGNNVNIKGSYYYGHYNPPVILYGKQDTDNIILCEVHFKEDFDKYLVSGGEYDISQCPFRMKVNGGFLDGEWVNGERKFKVILEKNSLMNKNGIESEIKTLEIPFWGDTEKHNFIGVYTQGKEGVFINAIKVIDKNNGKQIQVIDPQSRKCEFGFFMTAIYQNIERDNNSSIYLNCYSNSADAFVTYTFNGKKYLPGK